jgi:hypothetical protein
MSELRFERNDMTIIISSPDNGGDTRFCIFDHEDQSYGPNAATYLSPTQVQELIQHLTKTANTMQPNLQQPLTPSELFALATLPPDICEAIQKLLTQKRNITMDHLPKSDGSWNAYTIKEVFEHKGWKVLVDVPGYNESYSTTLVFSY